MDHVAKITNSADTDSEVSKVSEHFLAQHSAIKMLASRSGYRTDSIIFCRIFTIKDRCKKVRFQQTHNEGLRQLLLTVSLDLGA